MPTYNHTNRNNHPTRSVLVVVLLFCSMSGLWAGAMASGGGGGGNKGGGGEPSIAIYGCTRTRGYWQTHHCEAGHRADGPRRISWPPVQSTDACFNEKFSLVCGLNGLELYAMSEGDFGMWASLAHQLVATDLNLENGASSTPQIDADMARAYELLGLYCGLRFEDAVVRAEAETIKDRLDAYNNGKAPDGPPHCDADTGEPPCYVSEWTAWSNCSAACDGGLQQRERYIHCSDCHEVEEESRACNEDACCEVGSWTAWSACTGVCGSGGVRYRERPVSCHPDTPYPTLPASTDEEMCDTGIACCSTSAWGAWSTCSAVCGTGGVRARLRTVTCLDHPLDGGQRLVLVGREQHTLRRLHSRDSPAELGEVQAGDIAPAADGLDRQRLDHVEDVGDFAHAAPRQR